MRYDRQGDQHYDVTSAFIKSIRGSDADAALHYLARMIEAGEDPRFIARRLVILASEDIGLADPTALPTAVAAAQAVQLIGMPEARLNLAQATIALAVAPKSNAVITAIERRRRRRPGRQDRPGAAAPARRPLRGRGEARARDVLRYSHDEPFGVAEQQYAPDVVADAEYYQPTAPRAPRRAVKERWERVRRLIVRGEPSGGDRVGAMQQWIVPAGRARRCSALAAASLAVAVCRRPRAGPVPRLATPRAARPRLRARAGRRQRARGSRRAPSSPASDRVRHHRPGRARAADEAGRTAGAPSRSHRRPALRRPGAARDGGARRRRWPTAYAGRWSPETRNRIRFEMRREVKRARKQRRADLREARREWEARQRARRRRDVARTAA